MVIIKILDRFCVGKFRPCLNSLPKYSVLYFSMEFRYELNDKVRGNETSLDIWEAAKKGSFLNGSAIKASPPPSRV